MVDIDSDDDEGLEGECNESQKIENLDTSAPEFLTRSCLTRD